MSSTSNRALALLALLTLLGPAGCCLTAAGEGRDGGGTSVCTPPCSAAAGLTCAGGKCVCASRALAPCPTPSGGQKCTDLQTDPNCGSCGHVCDAAGGLICRDGMCICGVAGYGSCPNTNGTRSCQNLQADVNNCGACAHSCTGGNCLSGVCH